MQKLRMRRFIIFALAFVCCVSMLSACTATQEDIDNKQLNPDIPDGVLGFETVFACYETGLIGGDRYDAMYESKVLMYYLREKLTDTMYVWRTSGQQGSPGGYSYWSSGMTVMMDPVTGGPLTYDAFLTYIEGMQIVCSGCGKHFESPVAYCSDCGSILSVMEEENG